MAESDAMFRLDLLGPFRLFGPDGRRVELASKRGQALVAMLAVAAGGERTRNWLQDRLWGSRQLPQAQASLRRELSNLRKLLDSDGAELLYSDHNGVRLDLTAIRVDARAADRTEAATAEFLEGLDLPGEESFADWLREQRQIYSGVGDVDASGQVRLPKAIVDMSKPVSGFSGRQAIAVLPLENFTGDKNLDYLADGISEELIERLSRLKWLPVIARSASFLYRDRPLNLREVGESLGARYVLEGWLRRADDRLRLGLSLADVATGRAAWTQTANLPLAYTAAMINEAIVEIVAVIDAQIDAAETKRAILKAETDLSVDELIWRGRWHLNQYTREDTALAEKFLTEALRLSPNSPEALVQMTFFKGRTIWSERKDEAKIREFRQSAQRAIAADSEDGRAYMYAGMAEMWMRRTEPAMLLFAKAIGFNPSLALAHASIGSGQILSGDAHAGLKPLQQALRLGPNEEYTFYILGELAVAHCMLGNWDEAIRHADQSLLRRVAYWYAHCSRIVALVGQGKQAEAELAARQLLDIKPDFRSKFVEWLPFVDRKWIDFLVGGLRQAGIS